MPGQPDHLSLLVLTKLNDLVSVQCTTSVAPQVAISGAEEILQLIIISNNKRARFEEARIPYTGFPVPSGPVVFSFPSLGTPTTKRCYLWYLSAKQQKGELTPSS